jgi:hypothetical protein
MTLPLMSGCGSFSSGSRPAALPTESSPAANAYCAVLPAGTVIKLPSAQAAAQIRAVAVNETAQADDGGLSLTAPLRLVSPAYIAARDARELQLSEIILQLRAGKN